jgi:hypothetical protein
MVLVWLGVAALLAGVTLYLAARIAGVIRTWREPTTRWAPRSPVDRRGRRVAVAIERRRGPRREDDVARAFIGEVGMRPRAVPKRSTGSGPAHHRLTHR